MLIFSASRVEITNIEVLRFISRNTVLLRNKLNLLRSGQYLLKRYRRTGMIGTSIVN